MAINRLLKIIFAALPVPVLSLAQSVRTQAESNLLMNGGFESGKLAPWSFVRVYRLNHASYRITKPGLAGEGSYKFEYDTRTVYDPAYEGPEAGFGILQNVTAVKGAEYSLSFRYLNQPRGSAGETNCKLYVEAGAADWRDNYAPKNKVVLFKRNFTASSRRLLVGIYLYSSKYTL